MKEKEFQKFVKDNADVMPLFAKLTTKVLCNKGTDEENKYEGSTSNNNR